MKKALYTLPLVLLAVALCLDSCKKDDENTVEPTPYCYISSITLGTLTRYEASTDENGEATTTTVTYAGSYYPVAIDPISGNITNSTPLLLGTDRTIVPMTITGEGDFYTRPIDDEMAWTPFTAGNSIDFTTPVVIRAIATDGESYRDYTMTLNIRDNDPEGYTWEQMAPLSSDDSWLAGLQERRAITWQGGIALAAHHQDGKTYLATTTATATPAWTVVTATGADDADTRTLQGYNGQLWLSTPAGTLLQSADGQTWQAVAQTAATSVQLLAASSKALYAWINGAEVCASADGQTWTPVALEGTASLFPTEGYASLSYTQTDGTPRVIVAGQTGTTVALWNMIVAADEPWPLLTRTGDNSYILPWSTLQEVSLMSYSGKLIAIGRGTATFQSADNGLTWKEYTQLALPEGPAATASEHISACATGEYIWFFTGARLWRARLNSYGE